MRARLTCLMVLGCAAAFANDPKWVDMSGSDPKVRIYIDVANIRKSHDGHRLVWEWHKFRDVQTGDEQTEVKPYRALKFLAAVDCQERATALVEAYSFDSVEPDAKLVSTLKDGKSEMTWRHAVPGSVSDHEVGVVCAAILK